MLLISWVCFWGGEERRRGTCIKRGMVCILWEHGWGVWSWISFLGDMG